MLPNRPGQSAWEEVQEEELAPGAVIDLSGKRLGRIAEIRSPLSIEVLNAGANLLTSPSDIQLCPRLRVLHLGSNRIDTLFGLESFSMLEYLDVKRNKLRNLQGIGALPCLRYLDASENQIAESTGLMNCHALETLLLSKNCIRAPQSLDHLERLSLLDLRANHIQSLLGISNHVSRCVSSLYLDGNQLTDVFQLVYLRSFPKLAHLSIADTPLWKKLSQQG